MQKELAKQYEPAEAEERLYKWWMESGFFRPSGDATKPPYTIMMPPPNITGQLHMGHAFPYTMQDILIRWRRMQGYDTLWLPGTDHASIATEARIVEAMAKEGLTKDDIGREGFLERAWQWNETYGGRITEQLKKLGFSCDWERQRFTMDEGCNRAVNRVFCDLYEKGLIYRGERIINWCSHCLTSISDAEVEYEEKEGHFWHLRYPLADGSGKYLTLATTRPETMLGDTAVAVHPEDPRYQAFIGKSVILPVVGKEIPVVADSYVEMDFGTGVVKITPAHDPNDFEVGLRHNLPVLNVMTDEGKMNENAGQYAGFDRYECRKALVAELERQGFLEKVEPTRHNVGSCYRCDTVVEPRVSLQWFVKMKPLAEPAIETVRKGETRMVPERFTKTYFNWMENIKDWCISRQLWWGHRIPVWYCAECGEMTVAAEAPCACGKCGGSITQDPDTLDTWFSSALWPFSTLGWPENTADFARYYPTSTLVTAYDIIFFWVARMIFSGLAYTGKTPFDTVLFSGIVRDAQGRKMSKSLGNGIDPLEVIAQFGADALRFSLITGNSPGNDVRLSDEKVGASRNFANKLWNASRFIRMNLGETERAFALPSAQSRAPEDGWILSRLNRLIGEVTENLEKFELGIALQKIYDFLWDDFCDWYIELSKPRLQGGGEAADAARGVLVYTLERTLRLLHPFMPFVTEEVWQSLPHDGMSVMLAPWPEFDPALASPEDEMRTEILLAAIRAVRSRRAEMNVPPGRRAKLYVESVSPELFRAGEEFFRRLAGASAVEPVEKGFDLEGAVRVITPDCRITIPLGDLVDLEAERARLRKELEAAEKQIAAVQAKLSNEGFLAKAPENVVAAQREALRRAEEKATLLRESLRKC